MKNFLLLDDSEDNLEILEADLFHLFPGSTFFQATDPVQALSLALNEKLDLVFSDIEMPQQDGSWFLMQLRRFSSVPVIIISGAGQQRLKQLRDEGALDTLSRPYTRQDLALLLNKLGLLDAAQK